MDQVVGITLRADAGGFVGEVRRASGAIDALDGQARTAAAGLDRAGTSARTAGRAADRGAEGFTALDRRLDATGTTMQAVQRAAAALGGALAVQQVVAYADAWTQAESRLRLVTDSSAELARRQTQLVDLANATRTALDPTVDLYTRLARSTDQLGASSADLLTVTRAVNQAVQVSGATAAEASAGIVQLGQGLASGALRGDELRSVMEQLPRLARAIADGLGVTIGELRDLGTEGALAAEEVFRALRGQADIIDAEFRQTRATVSQAFTVLSNATQQYIGEADQGAGATRALSGAILTLADNFEVAGDAILTAGAGLSGVLAVRGVAAFAGRVRAAGAALTTIAGAAGAARVALAALGGPIGVALSLGTAAAVALSGALSDTGAAAADAGDQARRLAAALEPARAATEAQTAAADDQTDATERMVAALERGQDVSRETVRAALEEALARRETLRATLDQIEAQARLNRSVTDGISSPAAGVGAALAARARERRADVEANEENIERLTAQLDETARSARESASAAAAAGTAARAAGADFAQAGDDVRASASDLLAAERRARALAGAFEAGGDGARAQRARFLEASQTVRDWTATLRGAVDAGASQAEATAAVRGELAALARDLGASVAAGASLSEVQDALTRAVADSADVTARYEQRLESAREQQAALAQAQRSATEAVAGIAAEVENLAAQQAALDGGGLDALADRRALQRARDILGGLGREDLPDVVAALDAAGAEGDTLAERLADLIGRKEDLSAAVQQTVTDLEDETEAQEDNATATRDAAEALRGRLARERALLALEASGASAAQIDARRAVLETENDLRERGIDLTTEQAREEIALTREIARTRRAREAVNTVIEDGTEATRDFVAAAIEGGDDAVASLRDSLVGGLRDILAEMAAQAVRQAVIVPVVQQAIGGGAGGGTGGGLAGSALGGLDPTGGALGDALGLGRSLGADLVPGGFGGINSAINGFGANLGFASGAGGGTLGASAGAPGFIGPNTSGLFGSTTLSGFLGGAGAGFGAGSFANSLVGGEGGQVGSGLGAAGGAAIGSVVPGIGTLAGGLIGGTLGGLISGLIGGGGKDFNLETAPTRDGLTAGAGRRETPFGFIAVQESGISGQEFERGLTGQIAPLDDQIAQRLSAPEIDAVRDAFADGNGVRVDVGKEIDQSEIAQAIGDRFVTIFDAIDAQVPEFLAKAARTGKEGNEEALQAALDEAFGILDFRAEFDARVEALSAGTQDIGSLIQQRVIGDLDQAVAGVRDFLDRTGTAFAGPDQAAALREAEDASRLFAERLLGIREAAPQEALSDTEVGIRRLEATLGEVQSPASDLRGLLDDLGISAAEAGDALASQIAEQRRLRQLSLETSLLPDDVQRAGQGLLSFVQGELQTLRSDRDQGNIGQVLFERVRADRVGDVLGGLDRAQVAALRDQFAGFAEDVPGAETAVAALNRALDRMAEGVADVTVAVADFDRRAKAAQREANGDIFGTSLTRQVVARGLDGGAFDPVLRQVIAAAQGGDLDRDSAGRFGAVIQSIADSAEEAAPVLAVLSSALAESERVAREAEEAQREAARAEEQRTAQIERQRAALVSAGGDISQLIGQLVASDDSTRSPQARLDFARDAFGDDIALAQGNDLDALRRLSQSAPQLLAAQRAVTGAGAPTAAAFESIIDQLESLPATRSFEQRQLDLLGEIRGEAARGADEGARGANEGRRAAERLFQRLDTNDDGVLNAQEFANARLSGIAHDSDRGADESGRAAARLFQRLDTNDDGALSPGEFFAGVNDITAELGGLSSTDNGALRDIEVNTSFIKSRVISIGDDVDGVEGLLGRIDTYTARAARDTDVIAANTGDIHKLDVRQQGINAELDRIENNTDGIESALGGIESAIRGLDLSVSVDCGSSGHDDPVTRPGGGRADGGFVFGPGGPRDDAIPMMLSDGEFVVRSSVAQQFGPQLEALNAGGNPFEVEATSVAPVPVPIQTGDTVVATATGAAVAGELRRVAEEVQRGNAILDAAAGWLKAEVAESRALRREAKAGRAEARRREAGRRRGQPVRIL